MSKKLFFVLLTAALAVHACPAAAGCEKPEPPACTSWYDQFNSAYDLGANSYLQKPVAFNGLVQLLGVLDLYWLQNNLTAPPRGAQS